MSLAIDTAGLHPTTEACMETLQWLQSDHNFVNILEIGCGNGILSLTAASIWDAKVLAVDISEKAVADTLKNVAEYGLQEQITIARSEGFLHSSIQKTGPFDLIICNLLADTILTLAHSIKNNLKTDGYFMLSGILAWRADEVESVYKGLGFEIVDKKLTSPWQSYVFHIYKKT